MKYGVKLKNYLKGWYEVAFFDKRKDANAYYEEMAYLEWNAGANGEDDCEYVTVEEKFFDKILDYDTELRYDDELFRNEVVKNYPLKINDKGFIHTIYSNVRIINNDNYVIIPC